MKHKWSNWSFGLFIIIISLSKRKGSGFWSFQSSLISENPLCDWFLKTKTLPFLLSFLRVSLVVLSMASVRFREIMKKYGKVALVVHCSVSAASTSGLYIAIKNNVDVESVLEKFHLGATSPKEDDTKLTIPPSDGDRSSDFYDTPPPPPPVTEEKQKNRTTELLASTGGAFTLALLCNKALFPIRVPITIALTPPIARFLARRNIMKSGFWVFSPFLFSL